METKICTGCDVEKPMSEYHVDRQKKDGHVNKCKMCKKTYQANYRLTENKADRNRKLREYYARTGKEVIRAQQIKSKYGITPEQYDRILFLQDSGCAICGAREPGRGDKYFLVDHDHACCSGHKTCGKCVRGLLCHRCNTGIGMFADNTDILGRAAKYLLAVQNVLGEV